jgi:TonB family protein
VNLLAKATALDHGIAVERTVTPTHPGQALGLTAGKVTLDFYVDQNGHARLPVVRSATHPAFATAAIRALDGWKFNPPRRQGRPVIVHLQQDFVFASVE